jgi:hypothetical protein
MYEEESEIGEQRHGRKQLIRILSNRAHEIQKLCRGKEGEEEEWKKWWWWWWWWLSLSSSLLLNTLCSGKKHQMCVV